MQQSFTAATTLAVMAGEWTTPVRQCCYGFKQGKINGQYA
jgi:hypothetical protein